MSSVSQTASEFGLTRIQQIAITVQDVERATAFYRDVLGMSLLFRAPPGLSLFDCGGLRLMLSLPEGAEATPGNSILYYAAGDTPAAHSVLAAINSMPGG